ncbi:hypothetical protein JR316_0000786 [Psilocybe cubensis]|uniref:Uncharacterized protein n=1 Tax=Psilocybe cubensis TaxID=181762 RepID=A0ACB8HFV2_PSICU|nr:hypothetical protein JR316_0000786 [Psilocybe cubensis]KAH9486721.1 hypothetical protein JR316_0000786 [Psilocybe cubensis]
MPGKNGETLLKEKVNYGEGYPLTGKKPLEDFLFTLKANILPVIVTNHTVTIAAELEDGEHLVGQCEISHPMVSPEPAIPQPSDDDAPAPDGIGEYVSPKQNVMFESIGKDKYEPLPSRISRLYYINGYGMEIHPSPNPDFLANIASRDILVYSCGSLWTSIIPCLAMKGVALSIAKSPSIRAKVLLLNGENDRETEGYTAADYIRSVVALLFVAIVQTLNNNNHSTPVYGLGGANTTYPTSAFITDLVYLKGTKVPVDVKQITLMGVRCREFDGGSRFDAATVAHAMGEVWAGAS